MKVKGWKISAGAVWLFVGGARLLAAPVPVTDIITWPDVRAGVTETNGQTLTFIRTADGWYKPTGATCTYVAGGVRVSTEAEWPEPLTLTAALTGLKYTQIALNIPAAGATFSLGVTVADDSTGIVIGEIGSTVQTTADPASVYPLLNGQRVGQWVRTLVAEDYGSLGKYPFRVKYPPNAANPTQQDLRGFMTVIRASDFTNGTGTLVFDGIELADCEGFDPNIVATVGAALPPYAPAVTNKLPVTEFRFSPGFDTNPERDAQTLIAVGTAEGLFSVTGLECVAAVNVQFVDSPINEPRPTTTNAALSGLSFTTFAANPERVDYALPFPVTMADTRWRFFFGEISTVSGGVPAVQDPVQILPLRNGQPVRTFKLDVAAGDYGVESPAWLGKTLASTPIVGHAVSFALTDFMDGVSPAEAMGEVDGFRVVCPGKAADPNVFGMYDTKAVWKGTLISIR